MPYTTISQIFLAIPLPATLYRIIARSRCGAGARVSVLLEITRPNGVRNSGRTGDVTTLWRARNILDELIYAVHAAWDPYRGYAMNARAASRRLYRNTASSVKFRNSISTGNGGHAAAEQRTTVATVYNMYIVCAVCTRGRKSIFVRRP